MEESKNVDLALKSSFDKTRKFKPINIALLTVSDTRTTLDDKSGLFLSDSIKIAGHKIIEKKIVRDEIKDIQQSLLEWISNAKVDVIITTGGTGLTKRDVTVEAHKQLYEKEITAFSTLFTLVSINVIGTSAVQSRACAGVANGKYLFALPGSTSACRDAWEKILKLQLDYRHKPCNFVEIMPRLVEVT
jgi:molybdenum cofactor biosynthesis protein B